MFITLWRAIKFGLQNFWRNLGLSLTTVTILVLTLISVNVLFGINILTKEAIKSVTDQVDISLYFKSSVSMVEAEEVEKYLKTFSEVKAITLMSQADVLADFKAKHAGEPAIIDSINALEENPLPITLIIKTNTPGDYKKVLQNIDVAEYRDLLESKTYDDHAGIIERINEITQRIQYLAAVISIVFTIIAFLIIFNAIRVAIYSQREEIGIKKLVGATDWFIRAPFLFDGLLYAILAVVATAIVVFLGIKVLDPYVAVIFSNSFSMGQYFTQNAFQVFGLQFLAVLVLVGASSALAMRRHLRV